MSESCFDVVFAVIQKYAEAGLPLLAPAEVQRLGQICEAMSRTEDDATEGGVGALAGRGDGDSIASIPYAGQTL